MARDRGWPISQEDDVLARARRRAVVDRDIQLKATGEPCPGCGQTARLAGGEGCSCRSSADQLQGRCLDLADRVRAGGPR